MKRGLIAVIDQIDGREAAALIKNGDLQDLIIDPKSDTPQPEAIYRAKAAQMMKGQNGIVLDLGHGHKGFLRNAKGIKPGKMMLVQCATHGDDGKAAPVTTKLIFKSRYVIVTPNAPGLNIARKIRDDDERERLLEIVHDTLGDDVEEFGIIIRSGANGTDADVISEDLQAMHGLARAILADEAGEPDILMEAPSASTRAWRDWVEPDPDDVVQAEGSFEDMGVLDHIENLKRAKVSIGAGASMIIEPTSALVAVDVNTGSDFSLSAGLKANMATARELPKQLSLRGLGGQIVIDFAPSPKKDRRAIEQALQSAFRKNDVDTILVGWTPLGHFELQRKRERIPLVELLD